MKKILSIIILFSVAVSCSQLKTHGKFVSEQKDAWMDGYINGLLSERKDDADHGLVYCRANPKEDGTAAPICYKAKFK
jgi:hypothetical protein